jgi:protein-disulfide isomerase
LRLLPDSSHSLERVGGQKRESRELRRGKAAIADQSSRKPRGAFVVGGVIIAILLVAIVVSVIGSANKEKPTTTATPGQVVVPAGATADGALVSGKADAPVRLQVYVDYMCPYCGRFERANGAEIARLVNDGTVRLELHTLSFLDRMSQGTEYSTRAANAVATVGDRAPDRLVPFNNSLFVNQPEEGSAGLTDRQLAERAKASGVPDAVVETLDDRTFVPWVVTSTDAAFKSGITGTPTVKINGEPYQGNLYTAGPLTEAIMAAAK